MFRANESPEIVELATEVIGLLGKKHLPHTFIKIVEGVLDIKHCVVDGDCWYTCNKATEEIEGGTSCQDDPRDYCSCPRDYYVLKLLNTLKEVWLTHTTLTQCNTVNPTSVTVLCSSFS